MGPRTARFLVGAAVAACLLSAPASGAPSKLDARLRAKRAVAAGGFAPAGAGGPAAMSAERKVLLRVLPGTSPSALRAAFPGLKVGATAGDVITAAGDDAALDALAADSRVLGIEAATKRRPVLDVARSSRTVSSVFHGVLRNGAADLAALDGAGVVVGVVDTGIDWQHRDFSVDGAPDTTRILAIWDQTISSHVGGAFPTGFAYGAEYTKASIDAKLAGGANVVNTTDDDGHGTHVASIAAGDGTSAAGANFKGIAPAADLVIVRTSFFDTDIVDGMAYIVAKAAAAGKRAVINLSLGGQAGPHDGTSSFETGVSAIAASTPVIVAIGNDHASSPHARTVFSGLGTSNFTALVPTSPPESGELEFWHPGGDAYTVTVTLFGQGGAVTAIAGGNNSGTIAGHSITVSNGENTHPSGDKQILVSVTKTGGFTVTQITAALTRTTGGGSGQVDGFVDPAATGLEWATFVENTTTMGSPATALNVFSVGSYATKTSWDAFDGFNYQFTVQNALGTLSHFSAYGPTRDGRQAPEVVAPGDIIAGAQSADATAYASACDLVGPPYDGCFILEDNRHRILRGTSMAAPVAAGAAALRLQAQPGLTVAGLRTVLRELARTDSATGAVPGNGYGYGKLVASPQPVSPPSGFSIAPLGVSSITWSWGAVTGASNYRLYYATNTSSLLTTLTSPAFLQTGLAANTTYGLFIRGMAGGVDGPGTSVSMGTYANPVTAGSPVAHVSSVTLPISVCGAGACSGYSFAASTDAAHNGVVFTSATTNRLVSALTVTGLSALTTYYLRLTTLNTLGAGIPVAAGSTRTSTDLLPPINPSVTEVSSVSARFNWAVGPNPPGLTYVAQASSVASFGATLFSSTTLGVAALFPALSVNTSYYFRVGAVSGPTLNFGPIATHPVAPAAAAAAFTAVSSEALTLAWSSSSNSADTLYAADVSPASDFSSAVVSSVTRGLAASFAGLTPNTVYHARVTAIGHSGIFSATVGMGSTATFAQPVVPLGAPFSNQGEGGFSFSFGPGANPAGTRFVVRISTDPAFSVVHASSDTANSSATFSGLLSNQLYWAQASALNVSGAVAPFSTAQSTATKVKAVETAATTVSTRSVGSLTVAWAATGFGAGTRFLVEAALTPAFAPAASSSNTAATSAVLPGLLAGTSYYIRARALSLNPPTPDGAPLSLGAAYTLEPPPAAGVPAFSGVGASSFTALWTGGGAGAFRAEVSPNAAFTTATSSVVAAGATQATFTGLLYATTYYARVGSLNGDGEPNWTLLGSTFTLRPVLSSGPATGGGIALTLPAAFPVFPGAVLTAESGTFPNGAIVTIVAGTSLDVAAARSAVTMTPLGAGVAFDISASGYQPLKPVRLALTYDPTQIPAGSDARRLRLARYDEASGLWQLAPSAVDTKTSTLVASLDHFSVFAPFFTVAGAAPEQVVIYPNPWEVGTGNEFSGQAMTFASLPDGANVKILTMGGELVWEGTAGLSGVLTWDGANRFGHKAGSATYYAVIKSGGKSVTRRVVLIR